MPRGRVSWRTPLLIFPLVVVSAALVGAGFFVSQLATEDETRVLEADVRAAEDNAQRLETSLAVLEADRAQLRAELATALLELGRTEEHATNVEAALADTTRALEDFQADGDLTELLAAYRELEADAGRLAQLLPVASNELTSPALYIDRSMRQVVTTKAICSGSMEPTITCDDLLVMFEPSSVSELDVGDVIYFRQPASGCGGSIDGRFVLHRISRVISNADGVFFQTKGDALGGPDACLVPVDDVLYELLATVSDSSTAPSPAVR